MSIVTTRDRGSIDITWDMPPSCYAHLHSDLKYTQGNTKHNSRLNGNATRHTLHDLKVDEPFEIVTVAVYDDGTGAEREAASKVYASTSKAG